MSERFIHFSDKPLTVVRTADMRKGRAWLQADKPNGLWFSVEGSNWGWKQWCESEGFQLQSLTHATELRFRADARILRVRNGDELDTFNARYQSHDDSPRGRSYRLDWPAVADLWDAIIIAPYLWERRLGDHCFWYYGWDCASGCVWNADVVASLTPVNPAIFSGYSEDAEVA